jgi:hypothetical protein
MEAAKLGCGVVTIGQPHYRVIWWREGLNINRSSIQLPLTPFPPSLLPPATAGPMPDNLPQATTRMQGVQNRRLGVRYLFSDGCADSRQVRRQRQGLKT